VLHGRPAEVGVVTLRGERSAEETRKGKEGKPAHHERSRAAIGDVPGDRVVDGSGEKGDVVLKVPGSCEEGAGLVLEDADLGGLVHLAGGVEEAVAGDTGVGVDHAVGERVRPGKKENNEKGKRTG
jgi:hypothetical protein